VAEEGADLAMTTGFLHLAIIHTYEELSELGYAG